MSDDLIRSVEAFLRAREPTISDNQCIGCSKVMDGISYLRVDSVNEEGNDAGSVLRVCSWECMALVAETIAGGP